MQRTLLGLLLVLACTSAHATLLFRAGGLAYYDTTTNLTWVADANLAQTSGYDADGRMNWTTAVAWTASLNAQNAGLGYAGVNSWRLPTATDTGLPGCESLAFFGTDCGWNVDLATSEMGRMFSSTLGNTGFYDALGVPTGACINTTPICLFSTGPFSNLQPDRYWSGTVYALDTSLAWDYVFADGRQNFDDMVVSHYAWAVATGDVAVVPIPAAVWLFGSALSLMGVMRRKRSS